MREGNRGRRPLWWFAAPWGRHGRAGILHDYCYRQGEVQVVGQDGSDRSVPLARNEADYLFFSAMLALDRAYDAADLDPANSSRKGTMGAVTGTLFQAVMPLVRLFISLAVLIALGLSLGLVRLVVHRAQDTLRARLQVSPT